MTKTKTNTNNNKKAKLTKLLIGLAVMVTTILIMSLSFIYKNGDMVIAKVNGNKVYKSEMEERLKDVFKNADSSTINVEKLPQEVMEILAKDIFVQKELDKRAKRHRIIKSKETKKKIKNYTKKITRKEYLDSVVKEKITEDVVRDKYVELVNELSGKQEIHLRHILTKTKNDAQRIIRKIKAKKSFEELAKSKSLDSVTSKDGGDLGYVLEDSLTKEFAEIVKTMKKGAISQPIKTEYGWHIIKVEDRREAEVVAFEAIKDNIKEELEEQEIKNIFSSISDEAKIQIMIDLQGEETNSEKS